MLPGRDTRSTPSRPWWQRRLKNRYAIGLAVSALVVVTLGMVQFRAVLDKAHVALLYLLVVLCCSIAGRKPGLTAGISAFLLFDFLFLPPYYTLIVANPLDWLVLVSFLVTSVVATELMNLQRVQGQLAEVRRVELDQLATLGAETLNAARAEHALSAIARVIRTNVNASRCELFVRTGPTTVQVIADTDTARGDTQGDSLLAYVEQSGNIAIAHDDSTVQVIEPVAGVLPLLSTGIRAFAMPLKVRGQTVGVLRLSTGGGLALSDDTYRALNALAYYAALGIERLRLERTEETAEELKRADRLKDSLLAAVSHDLRTPLTTIKAIAHEISLTGSEPARIIEHEADELSAMVDGLLELSQLTANALPVNLQLNTMDELIEAALQRTHSVLHDRNVLVTQARDDMLVGRFDFVHSLRILVNLLENAAKYSGLHTSIGIVTRRVDNMLELEVADRGRGVAEADRLRIFEPFYRAAGARADVRGAGLGLSIAHKLAKAQGGDLRTAPREGGGSLFTLVVPAAEAP